MNAIVTLLISLLSLQQPRDRRDAPVVAEPTGTASISGTVIAADDGHPLGLANVVAIGALTGTLKITSTDRNGNFSFVNLADDRYTVGASKPPYIGAAAGARRAARPGTPIVVANGQKITNIRVALPRGAVIAGTIYDHRGQPAANASVILQQWKIQGDERVLTVPTGTSRVDADVDGRYRFYGVPPGEYLVVAMRISASTAHALTDSEVDQLLAGKAVDVGSSTNLRNVPFFFPGTPRSSEAAPIIVAPGEERLGVDMRVDFVRTARVDGLVVGPNGQPMSNVAVEMSTAAGTSPFRAQTTTQAAPDGRFSFPPSVPSAVVISATYGTGATALYAVAAADLTNGDAMGLQLILRPPVSIEGSLQFEGATKPSLAGRRVPLRRFSRSTESTQSAAATPTTDVGAFRIDRLMPGRYLIGGPLFFGASSDSVIWALKSVVADGKDVTDRVIEFSADPPPKFIVVTYTDQWQQLSGKLSHQAGGVATEETVIVFPADRAYWYQGSRRIVITRPGSDGLFSFGGPGLTSLPPGEYLLAAVTDLGRDEQFDPSFLATLVPAAAPITIGPGEKKTQDLVIR